MIRLVLSVLASVLCTALTAQGHNWIRSPINGHLYALSAPQTWTAAEQEAVRADGHLATIRSQQEQVWLINTFGAGHYWIGLNDTQQEGAFEWVSGEVTPFRNWCPGQPDSASPEEDCVHISNYPGWCSGGWNDQAGTDRLSGIIERPFDASFANILYVHSSNPNAFRTVQEAIDAALPGDRIVLQEDVAMSRSLRINKSLTLEGDPRRSIWGHVGSAEPVIDVVHAQMEIPVELRGIHVTLYDNAWDVPAVLRSEGRALRVVTPDAAVLLEESSFRWTHSESGFSFRWHPEAEGGLAVSLRARSVTMHDVEVSVSDLTEGLACEIGSPVTYVAHAGGSAVAIDADQVAIRFSTIYAGNGTSLDANCGSVQPCLNGFHHYLIDRSGDGGHALGVRAGRIQLAHNSIRDGVAGTVRGSCPPYHTQRGVDGQSILRGQVINEDAAYMGYRRSCASASGVPTLWATRPTYGQPWTLTIDKLSPNTAGFLFFSRSDRRFGALDLPFELRDSGAPNCFMNVDTDPSNDVNMLPLDSNASGRAEVVVGIPADPVVLGFEFFNQYVSLDAPGGRVLGITTTNAGRGVVGY